MFTVFTFFFSMFRAFFSITISTCFKTSDCPQVEKLPSDPGADPTSGLTDRTVPLAFITEGIYREKWKVCIKGDGSMTPGQNTNLQLHFFIPLTQYFASKEQNQKYV